MTLKDKYNLDLHSGKEINGMIRFNACYLCQNSDDSQTILFDNGNQYNLNADGEAVERIDAEDKFFIDRQIVKTINNFIDSNALLSKDYKYSESNYEDCIEFYRISKDEKKECSTLIRIVINRDSKRIDIPNIMIPFELKHNGLGKKILLETYKIARKHNYKLYLVQMVEGFYNRMVKRGAEIIMPYDIVEITEKTKLIDA